MSILRKYDEDGNRISRLQDGGVAPTNPNQKDEIPEYQKRSYGKGSMAKPYSDLGVSQRRFLDYKYGYQGYQNDDGTYRYVGAENPGQNYFGQSVVDTNKRQGGNNMANTHSAHMKMSSVRDPETGKAWKVPSQFLGKAYPQYSAEGNPGYKGVQPVLKKGGLLYKK